MFTDPNKSTGSKADQKNKRRREGKKHRKWDRNRFKCERYRKRVGKPNGPGEPGNKAGKNKA